MSRRKRVLVSPTAYKGTLSPFDAADLIASTLKKKYSSLQIDILPLADGGDGTLEVLLQPLRGKLQYSWVLGPLGKITKAKWGLIPSGQISSKKTAIIEMAEASGLKLINGKNKILEASSFGTGQLIETAIKKGCKEIIVGVGGTATADGGLGALRALGLKVIDNEDREIPHELKKLIRMEKVDASFLKKKLRGVKILVLCDVRNPLLGKMGSARVFGPQKGATPEQVKIIEAFLKKFSSFALRQTKQKPGSGAAGALAFGLSAFANAELIPGTPFVMNTLKWKKRANHADLIITGEGKLDHTSFSGKVIGEILKESSHAEHVVICGSTTLSNNALRKRKIQQTIQMGSNGMKNPRRKLIKATGKIKIL